MTYRYYIGIQLPEDIAVTIRGIQAEAFDPTLVVKPLEPHITLLPPPAVEQLEPKHFVREVKQVASAFLPFNLTFKELVRFDDRAIAIDMEGDKIHALQHALTELLPHNATVRYHPRPEFTPHVTLAQSVRGKKLPPRFEEQYRLRLNALLSLTFTVEQLTLFRWVAPRQYEAEKI